MSKHIHQLRNAAGVCRATIITTPDPRMMIILHDPDIEMCQEYLWWSDKLKEEMREQFPDGWQEILFVNNLSSEDPEQT